MLSSTRAQEQVTETTLANGLTVIMYEDHSIPLVALNLTVRAGTRYERPGYTGITDVCAEIFQAGTSNFGPGEYDRIIRAGGGTTRFVTGMDYSFFAATIPSRMLDTLLKMEADRLGNSQITFEKVVAARQTIGKNRVREIENTLYGRINQEVRTLSFQSHPYRNPRYGWPSDLSALTVDDVTEYYRSYFVPGNIVLALAGDFDAEKIVFVLQEYFESIPSPRMKVPRIPEEPIQEGERRSIIKGASDLGAMVIAYHVPGLMHEECSTLGVLIEIMAGGESSRIYKKTVSETDFAVISGGYYFGLSDPSLLSIWAIMNYGVSAGEVEKALFKEMNRLKDEPVSSGELEMAKNIIEADFYRGLRGYESAAANLAAYQVVRGSWRRLFDNVEKTRAVTTEDVMNVARNYFNRSNRTVIILEPPDQFEEMD